MIFVMKWNIDVNTENPNAIEKKKNESSQVKSSILGGMNFYSS